MGKQKSLFYQMKTCVEFVPRFDKHSDKRQDHDTSHIVKSLQSKTNLLDFSHQFCEYIKSEFKDVKQVRNITPKMCQSFIDKKAEAGCSEKTLKTYASNFNKLEKCVKHTFHSNVSYQVEVKKEDIKEKESIKDFAFTDKEMEKILDYKGKSKCFEVIKFNSFTGCRINTCEKILVRDLHIKGDTVIVDIRKDKGGRDRSIEVQNKDFAKYCRELRKGKNPSDKLFSVKSSSVNKFLRRRCAALNIRTPDGQIKSGNHSIRKNVATNYAKVHGVESTLSMLGHGTSRPDLEKIYIKK